MSGIGNLLITLLGTILKVMSPELRKLIEGFIKDLYSQAKKTSNVFDDLGVELLAELLEVKL